MLKLKLNFTSECIEIFQKLGLERMNQILDHSTMGVSKRSKGFINYQFTKLFESCFLQVDDLGKYTETGMLHELGKNIAKNIQDATTIKLEKVFHT
ncbi:MAG: hypothetical protein K0Q73_8631 [Paenibacillus sp.]|jgi:hypothetical protein|nr:hypothetical protein [Paenibacillus sp.]